MLGYNLIYRCILIKQFYLIICFDLDKVFGRRLSIFNGIIHVDFEFKNYNEFNLEVSYLYKEILNEM